MLPELGLGVDETAPEWSASRKEFGYFRIALHSGAIAKAGNHMFRFP